MIFTSFNFLFFFPVVIILYNIIPQRVRVWFLLIASYFFYINLQPVYAILLFGVTLSTYFFSKFIFKTKSQKKKQNFLIWGIIVIVLPLLFFKYFGVINHSIITLLSSYGLHLSLPQITYILPVGISFYTFMAIGYVVDVYNENVDFENNFASTGLFLSFFPIVLSGPIERSGNMFPQFKNMHNSSYEDLVSGFKMMLWGYFMKLCVADRLGIYVNDIFNNIPDNNGTTIAFAYLLYPFHVYGDLGGYSLIAIGSARALGIKIIPNFNRPFFATSMSEFWRRWHMSLIQWLTDYIFTPLSFSLRSWKVWGIVTALLLTFLISGVWHGAALTFIVWGFLQGAYLGIEALLQKRRVGFEKKYNLNKKPWYIFICISTVFVLFAFSQIFGRSPSVGEALEVINKIFTNFEFTVPVIGLRNIFLITMGVLLLLLGKDFSEEFHFNKVLLFNNRHRFVRWSAYYLVCILIFLFGVFSKETFIYFQF